jgi:hypothetical protein
VDGEVNQQVGDFESAIQVKRVDRGSARLHTDAL